MDFFKLFHAFPPFAKQNQGEVWPICAFGNVLICRFFLINIIWFICINFLLILFYCFLRFWSEVKWSVIVVEGAPPPVILGIDTWAPRQLNGSCKRGSCEGYPQPIKYTNTPRNKNTNTNWRSLWVHVGGKGQLGRWEGVNVIWENWRNALLTQTQ